MANMYRGTRLWVSVDHRFADNSKKALTRLPTILKEQPYECQVRWIYISVIAGVACLPPLNVTVRK